MDKKTQKVAIGVVGLLVAGAYGLGVRTSAQEEQVVKATRFVLQDAGGTVRGEWGIDDSGVFFVMGNKGAAQVRVGATDLETAKLSDRKGQIRLSIPESGFPQLEFVVGAGQEVFLTLTDAGPLLRLNNDAVGSIHVSAIGSPSIVVLDKDRVERWSTLEDQPPQRNSVTNSR